MSGLNELARRFPQEREAIDTYAFSQELMSRGGDIERRFALISLDNSLELILRAFLLKRGVSKDLVEGIRAFNDLLNRCIRAGLKVSDDDRRILYELHEHRNRIYHGRTLMLPTERDLKAWSTCIRKLILEVSGLDPQGYFEAKLHARASLTAEDLEYVDRLEDTFRSTPPYFPKLTWWSEIHRDVVEAGEKWDPYVHYRPRWPFFIPTLVLVKCNPYREPVDEETVISLESKASFLKLDKRVMRVWLGIVSSNDFTEKALRRALMHEGRGVGLVLINSSSNRAYCSMRGRVGRRINGWS